MKTQQKDKAIVFDFMRTLYDPQSDRLVYGAKRVLNTLYKKHDLFLVSYRENQRHALIRELGIEKYFRRINFVDKKTKREFKKIISPKQYRYIWIVGDRVEDEISIGNGLGWRTIWVAQGKFKNRLPKYHAEYPTYSTKSLYKILNLFYRQNKK
jgi:FMN phosphatase YigB (HAD superfamily)